MLNPWQYKNKSIRSITDLPNNENIVGFIYKITRIDKNSNSFGKIYIGKKVFHNNNRKKISKREITQTNTRKRIKVVTKESNWSSYYGSCKELKEDIEKLGVLHFKREILELCYTKKYMSFCEIEHQIKNDVLKVNSYNGNIMSRYYRKDMLNRKENGE